MRKVHIISTGEYSDWSCHAAFAEQPGKDFVSLCRQFNEGLVAAIGEYDKSKYDNIKFDNWHAAATKWLLEKASQLGMGITLDGGDRFGFWSCLYERVLTAWLVKEHGYEQLGVHDTEICRYQPPSKGWRHNDDIAWP